MTLSRSMGSRFDGTLGATALDTRLTMAALLARGSAGAGLAARPGVFPGAPAALVAGSSQGWNYQVLAASFATSRGAADGVHLLSNDGPQLVATDAAPGTSGASRIDIIYVLQPSAGENSDSSSTPVFGVARGNAVTGTPVAPTIPVGALELARNTITSAATSTASGTGNSIQQTWRYTALRGSPILVRNATERDELTAIATANHPITVDRLDTGLLERSTGTAWHPVSMRYAAGTVSIGSSAAALSNIATISFPAGRFTQAPLVFAQPAVDGADGFVPLVVARSATGASLRLYRANGGVWSSGQLTQWFAVQVPD